MKNGARVLFFPTDDDMHKNSAFPYFHASDAIFRALEYTVPVISANTNGVSIIVSADGRVQKLSLVNEKSAIIADVGLKQKSTFYERFGKWFGYLLVSVLVFTLLKSSFASRTRRSQTA